MAGVSSMQEQFIGHAAEASRPEHPTSALILCHRTGFEPLCQFTGRISDELGISANIKWA